jgi:hypothetical protein
MSLTIEPKPALSALDLGDKRELRILREGQKNTVWAFGRTRRLFFVTGHARSGTNWLAALLMRHPSIYVDGEYYFQELKRGFDAFRHEPYHRARSASPSEPSPNRAFRTPSVCASPPARSTIPTPIGWAIARPARSRSSSPVRRTSSSPATDATSSSASRSSRSPSPAAAYFSEFRANAPQLVPPPRRAFLKPTSRLLQEEPRPAPHLRDLHPRDLPHDWAEPRSMPRLPTPSDKIRAGEIDAIRLHRHLRRPPRRSLNAGAPEMYQLPRARTRPRPSHSPPSPRRKPGPPRRQPLLRPTQGRRRRLAHRTSPITAKAVVQAGGRPGPRPHGLRSVRRLVAPRRSTLNSG